MSTSQKQNLALMMQDKKNLIHLGVIAERKRWFQ